MKLAYHPRGSAACLVFLMLLSVAVGCGRRDPYACVRVSGKVTYEDGSLIPAEQIRVTFVPQMAPVDAVTAPRSGMAAVDVKSGQFAAATTYAPGDGIIAGKHKVLLYAYGTNMRPDVIPREYGDPQKTPLMVDTSQSPFELKVHKQKR